MLWWKNRTRMEKWLLPILALLVVLIIIILAVFLKILADSQVCQTPECVRIAGKILASVDLTRNPCDDFEQFTCGNFLKNTHVPPNKDRISPIYMIDDKGNEQMRIVLEKPVEKSDTRPLKIVKSFYQTCLNASQNEIHVLDNFKKALKGIGGWPVLEGDNWKEETFNWTATIYEFIKLGMGHHFFFKFEVVRAKMSPSFGLSLSFAELKFFDSSSTSDYSNKANVQAYHDYMLKIAKAFGAEEAKASQQMRDVIDLDIAIKKLKERSVFDKTTTHTIRGLEKNFPTIPWLQYINTMLDSVTLMTYDSQIEVLYPQYLKGLEEIIKNTPKKTLANYMFWHGITKLVPLINKDLWNLYSTFWHGPESESLRWEQCVEQTRSQLYIPAQLLYARQFLKDGVKKSVDEIADYIRIQMIDNVQAADWLDEESRDGVIEKVKLMKVLTTHPLEFVSDEMVEKFYQNVTINPLDYLGSVQNVARNSRRITFSKLNNPGDDWVQPHAVFCNGIYDAGKNTIYISVCLLQDVYFDKNRPQYVNYGSMGALFGHELTHGFDDNGRMFNKDGDGLFVLRGAKTLAAYKEKAQCLIEQYSNITVPEVNLKLNGTKSLNENIADNGAARLAYLAYKKWVYEHYSEKPLPGLPYTPEQLFWISLATPFCEVATKAAFRSYSKSTYAPNRYRINVPIMNSGYFAKDFNCPLGSPMNPKRKCQLW